MKRKINTMEIAFYGLFTALVFVATRFINIQLGPTQGGLFHLGNAMSFTIAIVFGRRAGAVSSALGMTIFDLVSGFGVWAPFTFIIRFAMGYVIGYMAFQEREHEVKNAALTFAGIIVASFIMISGYYIAEWIILGSIWAPMQSIFGNVMQCVVGTIAAVPFSAALRLALRKNNLVTNMNR